MKIRIRDDAQRAYVERQVIWYHQPVSSKWEMILKIIQGIEMEVETEYLFRDQFNVAPLPETQVDALIENLLKKYPNYENDSYFMSLVDEAKRAITTIGLRVVDHDISEIIDDIRPGQVRCHKCGHHFARKKSDEWINECPFCGFGPSGLIPLM